MGEHHTLNGQEAMCLRRKDVASCKEVSIHQKMSSVEVGRVVITSSTVVTSVLFLEESVSE